MRIMFNVFFVLPLTLSMQICYGQDYAEGSLINNFREDIRIEQEEYDGCVKWDNETKESYYLLVSSLSVEALRKYVSDPNPVIRSAVFVGLAQRSADKKVLEEILRDHTYDTAGFTTGTDAVMTWSVRNYMQIALDLKIEGKLPIADYQERLKTIRDQPKIIIAGVHHNIIEKDSLLKVDELRYSVEGYKIISFILTTEGKAVSSNNLFTEEIRELIRRLKPGDRIYIDTIRAQLPDKTMRHLPSMVLKVK
jgi:hypothetical protein